MVNLNAPDHGTTKLHGLRRASRKSKDRTKVHSNTIPRTDAGLNGRWLILSQDEQDRTKVRSNKVRSDLDKSKPLRSGARASIDGYY